MVENNIIKNNQELIKHHQELIKKKLETISPLLTEQNIKIHINNTGEIINITDKTFNDPKHHDKYRPVKEELINGYDKDGVIIFNDNYAEQLSLAFKNHDKIKSVNISDIIKKSFNPYLKNLGKLGKLEVKKVNFYKSPEEFNNLCNKHQAELGITPEEKTELESLKEQISNFVKLIEDKQQILQILDITGISAKNLPNITKHITNLEAEYEKTKKLLDSNNNLSDKEILIPLKEKITAIERKIVDFETQEKKLNQEIIEATNDYSKQIFQLAKILKNNIISFDDYNKNQNQYKDNIKLTIADTSLYNQLQGIKKSNLKDDDSITNINKQQKTNQKNSKIINDVINQFRVKIPENQRECFFDKDNNENFLGDDFKNIKTAITQFLPETEETEKTKSSYDKYYNADKDDTIKKQFSIKKSFEDQEKFFKNFKKNALNSLTGTDINKLKSCYLSPPSGYSICAGKNGDEKIILASYQEDIWEEYKKGGDKKFNIINIDLPTGYGKSFLIDKINEDQKYQQQKSEIITISLNRETLVQAKHAVARLKNEITAKINNNQDNTLNLIIDEAPMLDKDLQDLLYKNLWKEGSLVNKLKKINIFSVCATPHRQDIRDLTSENTNKAKIAYEYFTNNDKITYEQSFDDTINSLDRSKYLNLFYVNKNENWLKYNGVLIKGEEEKEDKKNYNLTNEGEEKIKEIYAKIRDKVTNGKAIFYLGKIKIAIDSENDLNDLNNKCEIITDDELKEDKISDKKQNIIMLYDKANFVGGDYGYWSSTSNEDQYKKVFYIAGNEKFTPDELVQILGRNRKHKIFDKVYDDNCSINFETSQQQINNISAERVAKYDKYLEENKNADRELETTAQAFIAAKHVPEIYNIFPNNINNANKLIDKLDDLSEEVDFSLKNIAVESENNQNKAALHFKELYGNDTKSQIIITALTTIDNNDDKKVTRQKNLVRMLCKEANVEIVDDNNQDELNPNEQVIIDYLKHNIKANFEQQPNILKTSNLEYRDQIIANCYSKLNKQNQTFTLSELGEEVSKELDIIKEKDKKNKQLQDIASKIEQITNEISGLQSNNEINNRIEEITTRQDQINKLIFEQLNLKQEAVQAQVIEAQGNFNHNIQRLKNKILQLDKNIKSKSDLTKQQIEDITTIQTEYNKELESQIEEINSSFKGKIDSLVQDQKKLRITIDERKKENDAIFKNIKEKSLEKIEELNLDIEGVNNDLSKKINEINDTLRLTSNSVNQYYSDNQKNFFRLNSQIESYEERINNKIEQYQQEINNKIEDLIQKNEGLKSSLEHLETQVEKIQKQQEQQEQYHNKIEQYKKELEEKNQEQETQITETTKQQINIEKNLQSLINELQGELYEKYNNLQSKAQNNNQNTQNHIKKLIETSNEQQKQNNIVIEQIEQIPQLHQNTKKLEEKNREQETQIQHLHEKINNNHNKQNDNNQKLEEKNREQETQIQKISSDYKKELQNLQNKYDNDIKDINTKINNNYQKVENEILNLSNNFKNPPNDNSTTKTKINNKITAFLAMNQKELNKIGEELNNNDASDPQKKLELKNLYQNKQNLDKLFTKYQEILKNRESNPDKEFANLRTELEKLNNPAATEKAISKDQPNSQVETETSADQSDSQSAAETSENNLDSQVEKTETSADQPDSQVEVKNSADQPDSQEKVNEIINATQERSNQI